MSFSWRIQLLCWGLWPHRPRSGWHILQVVFTCYITANRKCGAKPGFITRSAFPVKCSNWKMVFRSFEKVKSFLRLLEQFYSKKYAELFLFFRPFYPKYLKFSRKLYANDHEKTEKAQEQVWLFPSALSVLVGRTHRIWSDLMLCKKPSDDELLNGWSGNPCRWQRPIFV